MAPKPGPGRHVADALVSTAPLASRWIQRLLARHQPPLTVTQFLSLRAIAAGRTTATELAARAGVSGPAVSQLVAELEREQLVVREPVSADRRRLELTLSRRGEQVLGSATSLLRDQIGDLLAELPPREAAALTRALEQVERLLAGSPPPRRPPPPGPKHRRPPRR